MASPSEATYPFKQARNYTRGRIHRIDLIVVHCTAGPESAKGTGAEAVQNMFATQTRKASAHVTVDNNSIARSVHDWDTAWAAKGFNARGLHLELVGMPNQTRAQWLDTVSRATLKNGAKVIADWCRRYDIDPRWATLPQLKSGSPLFAFTTHKLCSDANPEGTGHWDPGPNFPTDIFIRDVKAAIAATPTHNRRLNPYLSYAAPCHRQPGVNQGGKVRFVEWALGLPIDGIFGDEVNAAVRALQHKHGRPVTGVVGDDHDWTMHYLKSVTR